MLDDDIVNVKNHGAVGDGSHDDTAAVKSAAADGTYPAYGSAPSITNVSFESCSDTALAYQVVVHQTTPNSFSAFGNAAPLTHTYDWSTWGTGPIVRYLDCQLMGYHQVTTNPAIGPVGKIIYDGCSLATEPPATFLRSTKATAPSLFQNSVSSPPLEVTEPYGLETG